MNILEQILSILEEATTAAKLASGFTGAAAPDVAQGAAIAASLEAIARKALSTYEAHTGQPLDLSQLHHIDTIADPNAPTIDIRPNE